MATEAELHTQRYGQGRWRTARKEHPCDRYFHHKCLGDGLIHAGARYFDTEDIREYTKGPVCYRACDACASAESDRPFAEAV